MEYNKNCAVILAAGEGKRMKSRLPKVLCQVLFKPMVDWVIDAAAGTVDEVCVVVGHGGEMVGAHTAKRPLAEGGERPLAVRTVEQRERLGTGHAVMQAAGFLEAYRGGNVLVLCGDAPLMDKETLAAALAAHETAGASATVISAHLENPYGYGRIIRDEEGALAAIVEQKDASPAEKAVTEVNSGTYWFAVDDLLAVLPRLRNGNAQGEYYLTDAIGLLLEEGKKAGAFTAASADVVLGANDRAGLAKLNEKARGRVISRLLAEGADIPCADGVLIGPDVTVGPDSCILPATVLCGKTAVGAGCRIGPAVRLANCKVEDGAAVSCCDKENETIV